MDIWFLAGASLVFFMQAGFAMVETGFTRAKNAGNIIMKNLMDFCIGTVMFIILGGALLIGEDALGGFLGMPNLGILTNFKDFGNWSSWVFNLVFCATAATIVSGAMAERTKFSTYCIYSGIISLVIYPIEAHWVWGGGWLAQIGFLDFAGSTCIHMVGGTAALIGAWMLGPRIGKFSVDPKTGKKTPNAIPGHSLTLGALGCFILWFGWYGFNGAAADTVDHLAQIFVTTTIAPAVASCTTMMYTWVKQGKPDVSMTLNASLAGLVGITAPCADTDAIGATIIGIVSGLLVCFGVWLLDYVLHVDDPVGAVAVHFFNGIWGTIAVGLFATGNGQNGVVGLFYGGGFRQLGIQLLGCVAVLAWAAVWFLAVFTVLKKTIGLRVTPEEEIKGLDTTEHNLPSAYADFIPVPLTAEIPDVDVPEYVDASTDTVPVVYQDTTPTDLASDTGVNRVFTKVVVVCKQEKFEALRKALDKIGVTGMTVVNVYGCGIQKGAPEYYRGAPISTTLLPKVKVEIVISKIPVAKLIATIKKVLYTGHIGDGKIFVYKVDNVIRVRTGEEGYDALQDEE